MLAAVNGYIDGNKVVVDENLSDWQGRNVVVTILESAWNGHVTTTDNKTDIEKRRTAAQALAGMWKNHEDALPVDETVRSIRRGRRFDITVVDKIIQKCYKIRQGHYRASG